MAAALTMCLAASASFVAPIVRNSAALAMRTPAVFLQEAPPAADTDLTSPYSEMELAEQDAKLTALSEKWKRMEEELDYQDSIRSGFGPSPERINGRTAMFFIIVGLVTEYYTGQSMPQQVYTMLQTLAIVD